MYFLKERSNKLLENLQQLIYREHKHIDQYKMIQTRERFENVSDLDVSQWLDFDCHEVWGGDREYFWFATTVVIPEEFDGQCVVFELKTGKEGEWDATNPQFLSYVNGHICQGLDVNHREIVLTENAKVGEEYRIVLSAFTGDSNFNLKMDSYIAILDRSIEKLYYDLKVPYDVMRLLDQDSEEYYTILKHLTEALNLIDLRIPYSESFYESIASAQRYITKEFYENACGSKRPMVHCVGHTHIDVAWLWSLAVTRDKSVRSFSTVINYMKEYPDYIFMSSQPQLYQYVKETAPEVYEQIKEMVKEGRWEPEGAAFVEPDCNLSSGESLVRQILYGKQFFKEEFGVDSKIMWLPDVFGYSAALPQIMKKSGIEYFMTTKISWNEFNKMPYDTFEWEGLDGTKILTHFICTQDYQAKAVEGGTENDYFTTYNGHLNPSQVKGCWNRYSQKYLNEEVLISYGWGDGGGGPTKEMIECQQRLAKGIPGCPQTKQSTALEFFESLEEHVNESRYLPTWVGELYLEYHRGTYTSMARNKKWNRRSEYLMTNTEFLSTLARDVLGMEYPDKTLHHMWEIVMRNQFHDILPGSSIKEVYEDSKGEYQQLFDVVGDLKQNVLNAMTANIHGNLNTVVVFNPNSFEASDFVTFAYEGDVCNVGLECDGVTTPVQRISEDKVIAFVNQIPSKGYKTFRLVSITQKNSKDKIYTNLVDTDYLRVEIDSSGHMISIYDKKEQRELLKSGEKGNVIISYEDRPHNFDAWDINNYYTEKSWSIDEVESIKVMEEGPVRYSIRIERKYLESTIVQDLYFYPNLCRIDIKNTIDWKQQQILLRNYFPVDIHSNEATYDIQYGNVKRPTHYNTSWDVARFEVCAHKWLDLSEDGYGISVLNDCKYGCDVHNGVIGLSMLKSPIYPNPDADKEKHEFTYSIIPHKNGWREAQTVQNAYLLNNKLMATLKENEGGNLPEQYSFVNCNQENVIIEVIKQAEEGNGTILRLYECYNRTVKTQLEFSGIISKAYDCDMLENIQDDMEVVDQTRLTFTMKPYEIKTIMIKTLEE